MQSRCRKNAFYEHIVLFVSLQFPFLICLSLFVTGSKGLSYSESTSKRFILLGGAGRIGTAVASHLVLRSPNSEIILIGRNQRKGQSALTEVLRDHPRANVKFQAIENIWKRSKELEEIISQADCVIHTAGPYLNQHPVPLEIAIDQSCPVYIDVADPLPYLETACLMNHTVALKGKTTAMLAAGAFPGMSNVLAMEAADSLPSRVQDVRFQYFTAGLGGSGSINLLITNLGFGEPMVQFDGGALRFFPFLSGRLLGKVDFFLPKDGLGFGNDVIKERVGTKQVFSWPFPEAATVPTALKARGQSLACMGTAPDAWNSMLGVLVQLIPRSWWRDHRFSQFLADFSEPLVLLTDQWLRLRDPAKIGETHAMRIDVSDTQGRKIAVLQAHDSFRRCVAQSCAEFALDCLERSRPGVYLPEQRYEDPELRKLVIEKLTRTPGTFCYSGPVDLEAESVNEPSQVQEAIFHAKLEEESAKY